MASTPIGDELAHALPAGTRLGEYEITGIVGTGGFSVVYAATDNLGRRLAIKEYMPESLARRLDGVTVAPRSERTEATFRQGLDSFVKEAKTLARFRNPAILGVYAFWEAHGTAYMAMPLITGRTLKEELRARAEPPDEAWLRQLASRLLDVLEVLHAERVWHRDIAPDNIVLQDGEPVLLDFGAARQVISDRAEGLTAILKPSYAPIEQYAESRQLRQGPWTDLYALGAMVHELILGRTPPAATARSLGDEYQSLVTLAPPGYSRELLACVDWMLRVHPQDRPQSVAHLRAALEGRMAPPEPRMTETLAVPPPVGFEETRLANDSEFAETRQLGDSDFLPTRAMDAPDLLLEDARAASAPVPLPVPEPTPAPPPSRRVSSRRGPPVGGRRWPWALGLLAAGAGTALLVSMVQLLLHRQPAAPSELALAASEPASAASADAAPAADPVLALVQSQQETARPAPPAAPSASGPAAPADKISDKPVDKRATDTPARKRKDPAPAAASSPTAPAPAPVERTPPVAAYTPGPASAPAPADTHLPVSPSEACGKRVFLARALCLDEQCATPRFHGHAECVALREAREQRQRNRN